VTSGGLRDHLTRLLHWELNVRDLARSVAFYEALTPLRATPVVDDGRTRSLLLVGDAAPLPRLRLVEWREPRTTGVAHGSIAAIGFTRVVLHVADLDRTRELAESLGIAPVAPTTGDDFRFELGSRGSVAYRVWSCLDPHGIVVEFLENPIPKVSTVAQGTATLARDLRFFTGVLGLDLVDTVATTRPMPNVYLPGGAPVEFRGVFLRVPGDPGGYLDLLEHRDPAARHPPYDVAHHVGAVRCAFAVDDLDAAERALRDAASSAVPFEIDDARVVDFGGPLGDRRVLDLRDPEGVSYQLVDGAG
jgi:catechol 2,3-dioxygenase-like lactoylglutathione lyase family enzyme